MENLKKSTELLEEAMRDIACDPETKYVWSEYYEKLEKQVQLNNIELSALAEKPTSEPDKALGLFGVSPCFSDNVRYYKENEGEAKTFRDFATDRWYYEKELITMIGAEKVNNIKSRCK